MPHPNESFKDFLERKGYKTNAQLKDLGLPPNPRGERARLQEEFRRQQ